MTSEVVMSIQSLQKLLCDVKTPAISIEDRVPGSAKQYFFFLSFLCCVSKKEMLNFISVQLVQIKRQFFPTQVHGPPGGQWPLLGWTP